MKKLMFIPVLILVILFNACSSDEKENASHESTETTPVQTIARIEVDTTFEFHLKEVHLEGVGSKKSSNTLLYGEGEQDMKGEYVDYRVLITDSSGNEASMEYYKTAPADLNEGQRVYGNTFSLASFRQSLEEVDLGEKIYQALSEWSPEDLRLTVKGKYNKSTKKILYLNISKIVKPGKQEKIKKGEKTVYKVTPDEILYWQ